MSNSEKNDSDSAQSTGFKFVDRRRFDESGELRSSLEQTPPLAQEQPEKSEEQNFDFNEEDVDPASGPVTFSLFLQSLAQQTIMAMGIIPWPDTGETKANFDHARETIDILTILHEKTQGNLSPSEQRFFDSVLYELRVTFMKLIQGGTP